MTPSRIASCVCTQLSIRLDGPLLGTGICHCLSCQQRTGSVFAALAAFRGPFYDCRRHSWVQLPPGTMAYDKDPPD